ncbi:hypothetical protein [Nocardia tenerifensis]|uniref:hypothetical protein n=1 Tax=Nocardia tenerifensis TaxID=228006 RepID=UPI0014759514|nr:hypothetical protein [Nocardia tenerifensis]
MWTFGTIQQIPDATTFACAGQPDRPVALASAPEQCESTREVRFPNRCRCSHKPVVSDISSQSTKISPPEMDGRFARGIDFYNVLGTASSVNGGKSAIPCGALMHGL